MVQGVKSRVPNQESAWPFRHLSGQLALGVVISYGLAISITMPFQSRISQHRIVGRKHFHHLRPTLLRGKRMSYI